MSLRPKQTQASITQQSTPLPSKLPLPINNNINLSANNSTPQAINDTTYYSDTITPGNQNQPPPCITDNNSKHINSAKPLYADILTKHMEDISSSNNNKINNKLNKTKDNSSTNSTNIHNIPNINTNQDFKIQLLMSYDYDFKALLNDKSYTFQFCIDLEI